jgi:hypothetical protein
MADEKTALAPEEQNSTAETKSFTQAELDKIGGERLRREREKYADYEDLKTRAARLEEMEKKPAPQKDAAPNPAAEEFKTLRREIAELRAKQAENDAREKQREREARIRREFEGYPEDQKADFVTLVKGDADEEITQSVKALKERYPVAKGAVGGATNPPASKKDIEDAAAEYGKKRAESKKSATSQNTNFQLI